jgi:hypothetical protein
LRAFATALLVFCFVAAETFSAVHALDLAAHADHDPCEICVGTASFAGAATAPPSPQVIGVASAAAPVAPALELVAGRAARLRPPPRAPPVLS